MCFHIGNKTSDQDTKTKCVSLNISNFLTLSGLLHIHLQAHSVLLNTYILQLEKLLYKLGTVGF